MKTLLIYLILTNSCRWEFLAIEHVDSLEYCQHLSEVVHQNNSRNRRRLWRAAENRNKSPAGGRGENSHVSGMT